MAPSASASSASTAEVAKLEEEIRLAESQARAEKATFDRCDAAAESLQEEAALYRSELAAANIPSSPRVAAEVKEEAVLERQASQTEERRLAAEYTRVYNICEEFEREAEARRELAAARFARLRHAEVQVQIESAEEQREEANEPDPMEELLATLTRECEQRTQSKLALQERLAGVRQLERVAIAGADPRRVSELAELHRESAAQQLVLRGSAKEIETNLASGAAKLSVLQGGRDGHSLPVEELESQASELARELLHLHSEARQSDGPPDMVSELQALRDVVEEHEAYIEIAEQSIANLQEAADLRRSHGKVPSFDPANRTLKDLPMGAGPTNPFLAFSQAPGGVHLPMFQGVHAQRASTSSAVSALRRSQGTIHRPSLAAVTTAGVKVAPTTANSMKQVRAGVEQSSKRT